MTIKTTKMPRIDPKQLLKTLSVLLSPTGGIKSADEVNRLVQLMQKFSKKLVSKCIYIQILTASSEELLNKFLTEKGWGLLNLWFADAIRTNNWPECGELIQLFAVCPMTAARLKDNVEVNQAPKLIRQLSCDARVKQGIRSLAVKVLNKWMSIVQCTPQSPPARSSMGSPQVAIQTPAGLVSKTANLAGTPSVQKTIKLPSSPTQVQNGQLALSVPNEKSKPKPASVRGKGGRAHVSREFINSDSDSDGGVTGRRNSVSSQGSVDGETKSDITDDDTKPIKLLMGITEELSQSLKKEEEEKDKDSKRAKDKIREKESRKEKERAVEKEKARREKEKSKQREREREERRKQERERERQKEKERRENRSKPYSQTELKDDLGSSERERIKIMAQKMKDEAKNDSKTKPTVSTSLTVGMGKIPKISKKIDPVSKTDDIKKKEDSKKDKGGASFADLLGAMDTKVKKSVKVSSSKNKNKELLESLSSTNLTKQPSKTKTENKLVVLNSSSSSTSTSKKDSTSPGSSPSRKEHSDPPKKDYERRDIKDTTKSEKKEEKDKKEEKEKPSKIVIPEKKGEKRSSDAMSPPVKEKKKTLTESSMFGDILSTIMKDDIIMKDEPRKKKRRLSDVKAERAAKEAAELAKKEAEKEKKEDRAEKEAPTFSFYRDVLEEDGKNSSDEKRNSSSSPTQENGNDNKNGSDNEMEFQEPMSSLPREVVGILVYAKGIGKTKKSIKWEEEPNLVQIEYFEMNEDERVNVNKIKFETAKQRELASEKAYLAANKSHIDEENPENRIRWRLILLDNDPPVDVYGKDSQEKGVQELRENSVLQALFFNNKIPSDPIEPDVSNLPRGEPKLIPGEDTSDQAEAITDYSLDGWPDALDERLQLPAPAMDHDHVNELLSSINPNLIQNVMGGGLPPATGNPAIDNALFAAQRAAAETLRMEGLLPPVVANGAMHGPPGHFDMNIPPPYMTPPPMETGMFSGPGGFVPPQEFGAFPPMDNWIGVPPGGPHRGFGNEFGRGGPRGGFQTNEHNRNFGNNRGFGNDRDRHWDRSNYRDDRRDDRRGDRKPDERRQPGQNRAGQRPCKF